MRKLLKKERGRVEGNKEIYIKLGELILVKAKEKKNYGRFEPGKFGALGCKEILKSIYCIGDSKERDIETRYCIGDHRKWGIDNT